MEFHAHKKAAGGMSLNAWEHLQVIPSRQFTCWKCGCKQASDKGWKTAAGNNRAVAFICVCHQCDHPTFVSLNGTQVPGVLFGNSVEGIDDESVRNLYEEARNSMQVSSYTAVVLACRKLLMHVAVSKGAAKGSAFTAYVDYLVTEGYVSKESREWVDHIRQRGNEANHEINIASQSHAGELLTFVEMLLKIVYEFPSIMKAKSSHGD